eukprot:4215318-Pleurochrysis_carterae.AAC.1
MVAYVSTSCWLHARRSCSTLISTILMGVGGSGDASKLQCDGWCALLPGIRVGVEGTSEVWGCCSRALRSSARK